MISTVTSDGTKCNFYFFFSYLFIYSFNPQYPEQPLQFWAWSTNPENSLASLIWENSLASLKHPGNSQTHNNQFVAPIVDFFKKKFYGFEMRKMKRKKKKRKERKNYCLQRRTKKEKFVSWFFLFFIFIFFMGLRWERRNGRNKKKRRKNELRWERWKRKKKGMKCSSIWAVAVVGWMRWHGDTGRLSSDRALRVWRWSMVIWKGFSSCEDFLW